MRRKHNQLSPYDLALGRQLKKKGMTSVLAHQTVIWIANFEAGFLYFLLTKGEAKSEDGIYVAGMPPGHSNGVGANVGAIVKKHDLCLDRYIEAERSVCHAARIGVWKRKFPTNVLIQYPDYSVAGLTRGGMWP